MANILTLRNTYIQIDQHFSRNKYCTAKTKTIKTTGWHSNHYYRMGTFTGIIMLGVIEIEWREWAQKSFQSCGYPLQKRPG